jgi:hypothetical protein
MKRLLFLAAGLYPRWWRQRYGDEFDALLEDINPNWRAMLDVLTGAMTMQMKTVGTLPVIGILVGALAGAVIAMNTPQLFASSATFQLTSANTANDGPGVAKDVEVALESVVGTSDEARKATSVQLGQGGTSTLVLSYQDRDPEKAKRVADSLAAAVAQHKGTGTYRLLDAPRLATVPVPAGREILVASGGGLGLLAGVIARLMFRPRRRPAGAE